MSLFYGSFIQATDVNGDPLVGAKWKFYITGTLATVTVYGDEDLTTPLGAVVTSDSAGRFVPIYLDDQNGIRAILTDAGDGEIFDLDPVNTVENAGSDSAVAVETRTALKNLNPTNNVLAYLLEAGRQGLFVKRIGPVPTDTREGIYVASNTTGYYWERDWDKVTARPEWWGAVAYPANEDWGELSTNAKNERILAGSVNRQAIHDSRDFAPVTQLSPGIYYTDDCVYWLKGDRTLRGSAMRYGFTEVTSSITLCGPLATYVTVFQFGANDYANVVRGQLCEDVCFSRTEKAVASTTGDAEDGVKGVLYRWTTNSEMRRCRVFNSPIGFHVTLTATSNLIDCNVDPGAGAVPTGSGIIVAFLFGGYTRYPGFVGSNGSLRAEGNTAFGFGGSAFQCHTLVYGYTADTWIDKAEGAIGQHGVMITGCDKVSMTSFIAGGAGPFIAVGEGGAHQDVTVANTRIDGFYGVGFYFHHMNTSTSINVYNPYGASNDTGFALNNVEGRINIEGGELLSSAPGQGGIDANNVENLRISGIYLRDFDTPVQVANCVCPEIRPVIMQNSTFCGTAVTCKNVDRGVIAPMARALGPLIGVGVSADTATTYSRFDVSGIDPGSFPSVDKAFKLRYNGQDASPGGAGNSAFNSAGNVQTGVTG